MQSSAQSSTSFGVYVDISPQRAARVVADVGVDNNEAIEKLNCELATMDTQKNKFLELIAVLNIKRRRIEHKIYELRVEQEQALIIRLSYTGRACSRSLLFCRCVQNVFCLSWGCSRWLFTRVLIVNKKRLRHAASLKTLSFHVINCFGNTKHIYGEKKKTFAELGRA